MRKIVGVTDKFIAIQKGEGTVVFVPIDIVRQTVIPDLQNMTYLRFTDSTISIQFENGCAVTDFKKNKRVRNKWRTW